MIDPSLILRRVHETHERAGLLGAPPPYHTRDFQRVWPRLEIHGSDALPPKSFGLLIVAGDRAEIVFRRRPDGELRQRIDIAHELGHLALHVTDGVARCQCAQGGRERDDVELEAEIFGHFLLMPHAALSARWGDAPVAPADPFLAQAYRDRLDQVAADFLVPRDALERCLRWVTMFRSWATLLEARRQRPRAPRSKGGGGSGGGSGGSPFGGAGVELQAGARRVAR